jgi:hypothetical protein
MWHERVQSNMPHVHYEIGVVTCTRFMQHVYLLQDGYFVHDTQFVGTGICPYDGRHTSAYVVSGGDVYAGAAVDFNARQSVLHRRDVRSAPDALGLSTRNAQLNSAAFVGALETRDHVYMIMRETADELVACGGGSGGSSGADTTVDPPSLHARIARVCKQDKGTASTAQRAQWTSFVKARLNCSLPGDYPFYFDQIGAFIL